MVQRSLSVGFFFSYLVPPPQLTLLSKDAIPYIEFTVANRFYVYQRDHARKALTLVNKTDLVKRHLSFFLDYDIPFDAFYWVF